VDPRDRDGWTPLHLATSRNHYVAVERLLDAGADPLAKTRAGDTPMTLTRGSQSEPVRGLLARHGAPNS
jgi:ankyrin repeat protein